MSGQPPKGPGHGRGDLPPIDFRALAEALLARADQLVPVWLPGGTRNGHEWVCGSLSGGKGGSCSVNLVNGKWADFSSDDLKGNDLVSLYAAIHELSPGQAAKQVAEDEGLESVARIVSRGGADRPPPPPRPPAPPPSKPEREPEGWKTMIPVPDTAPRPTFRHQYRQAEDIIHTATYMLDGALLGYVVRFRTSDGGKETLPYTWCQSERDGSAKWHWRQWDQPRPLYMPGGRSVKAVQGDALQPPTVVLVEGEKKSEALQALLDAGAPGVYVVASWPGGSKAWAKALWSWLDDCTVICWPDCDSKRERLTKTEREAAAGDAMALAVAEQAKPLLAEHKQPGIAAMLGIGALLRAHHGCTVQLLPIPKPGDVVDGWDCGDAIETDGWTFDRVLAFFGQAYALPDLTPDGAPLAVAAPAPAETKKRDGPADAGAIASPEDAFADLLAFVAAQQDCEVHELGVTRKLVISALRKSPPLQCLGYDELRDAPSTSSPWPWRSEAGPLLDSDDLRLGDWLSSTYKIKAASRAALGEAMDTVADERRFHPIRDWMTGLQHDGKPRLEKWLLHVLGHSVLEIERMAPKLRRYIELVGRYVLLGLVARVMQPGCKFDYSLVLEGKPGRGKSSLIKALVGEQYFSDTHFELGHGGKEGFEQFQGLWAYEMSELTSLRKADSEQIKQFFSSQVDRYRGAYGRYVQAHPRQVVIFCSTNKRQYLYDLTGNRRFWPIWVEAWLRLDWLKKWREQMFAEALVAWRAKERIFPTPEEEAEFFEPEQKRRLVETAVQGRLYELLTRDGAPQTEGKATLEFSGLTKFVTLDRLALALGADPAKSSSLLEGQIRGWLEAHGWEYGRESTGQRRRGYRQPAQWPPEIEDEDANASPDADSVGASSPPGAGDDGEVDADVPF